MSAAVAINKREALTNNTDLTHPLTYHNRTGHTLPAESNVLQHEVYKLLGYCQKNEMVINKDKTKVVLFITGKKYVFMPQKYSGGC